MLSGKLNRFLRVLHPLARAESKDRVVKSIVVVVGLFCVMAAFGGPSRAQPGGAARPQCDEGSHADYVYVFKSFVKQVPTLAKVEVTDYLGEVSRTGNVCLILLKTSVGTIEVTFENNTSDQKEGVSYKATGYRIVPSTEPPAAPFPACTSAASIETLRRVVGGLNWPLGGGSVKIFKIYNYRPNPDLGGKPTTWLTDTKSPCKANLLTDRGEFGFTYRWKRIEGDLFMEGQFGDPDND